MDVSGRVGNPRFFACTGPHSLSTIAAAVGCTPPDLRDVVLHGLASLESASPSDVSFIGNKRLAALLDRTRAGAVLVTPELENRVPRESVALAVGNPFVAWAKVAALFHPVPGIKSGIHPSAVVDEAALVDPSAEICAHAVIGAHAEIGARCSVGPGTVIGDGVRLGTDCRIGPNASISHAILGDRVYVYTGARIGQEGFGFTMTDRGFLTTPQLGSVIIGDDVEVGANTTIDRGALRDTVIGAGTRLDNLVQVGHAVRIGRCCAISGQVGLSGSCEIDDFVTIGGQAGIADHIRVGAKVQIGAQAGVMSEVEPGASVVGSPARPVRQMFREIATLTKLAQRRSTAPES